MERLNIVTKWDGNKIWGVVENTSWHGGAISATTPCQEAKRGGTPHEALKHDKGGNSNCNWGKNACTNELLLFLEDVNFDIFRTCIFSIVEI